MLEAIVIFVLKLLGSTVLGHYVKRSLDRFDKEISALFQKNEEPEKIANAIRSKGLEEKFTSSFSGYVDSELAIAEEIAALADIHAKMDLLHGVLSACWELSTELGCDVVLLGSPYGASTVSVFLVGGAEPTRIDKGPIDVSSVGYFIIPFDDEDAAEAACVEYYHHIRRYVGNGRVPTDKPQASVYLDDITRYKVSSLGGISAKFEYPSLAKVFHNADYLDFFGGLNCLLDGIELYRSAELLTDDELGELDGVIKRFKELFSEKNGD